MVVVAIIGTMVALIGVSMSRDSDRLAKLESQRFHAIVNEVRDEAIITGESYFLLLDEDAATYQFQPVRKDRSSSQDEGLLKLRSLQKGVALTWDVVETIGEDSSDGDVEPRVLITPLGEITPFETEFIGDETTYVVFIDAENQLARRDKNTVLF